MDYEKLKTAAETITMPEEMKRRIIRNCKAETGKEIIMKSNKRNAFFRKPAAGLVAALLCLSLSVAALAAAGTTQGFFRDITNWAGAVVGTSYQQATDEIDMSVTVNGDELTVMTAFADPQMIPYRYTEKLGIAAYQILDANGKVVKEGAAESAKIANGQAAISIQLDGIANGNYNLIVTTFVSEKKADQPLNIHGNWEGPFTK